MKIVNTDKDVNMLFNTPKPAQRLTNAILAILVVCSIGAYVEGTGCIDIRILSCRMFVKFYSHVPLYVLAALALSEIISWGLLSKLIRRNS